MFYVKFSELKVNGFITKSLPLYWQFGSLNFLASISIARKIHLLVASLYNLKELIRA